MSRSTTEFHSESGFKKAESPLLLSLIHFLIKKKKSSSGCSGLPLSRELRLNVTPPGFWGGGAYGTEVIRLLRDHESREKWLIKQSSWAELERWPRHRVFYNKGRLLKFGSFRDSDTRKLNLINNAWQEVGACFEVCALRKKNIYIYIYSYSLIYTNNTHKVSLYFIFLKTLNLPNLITNCALRDSFID